MDGGRGSSLHCRSTLRRLWDQTARCMNEELACHPHAGLGVPSGKNMQIRLIGDWKLPAGESASCLACDLSRVCPAFSPNVIWDWLQPRCDTLNDRLNGWMGASLINVTTRAKVQAAWCNVGKKGHHLPKQRAKSHMFWGHQWVPSSMQLIVFNITIWRQQAGQFYTSFSKMWCFGRFGRTHPCMHSSMCVCVQERDHVCVFLNIALFPW